MLDDGQAYTAEVQSELRMAQQLQVPTPAPRAPFVALRGAAEHASQVSGVPFFVSPPPQGVQGRPLGVSGAQPTDTLVDILSDDLGLDAEHVRRTRVLAWGVAMADRMRSDVRAGGGCERLSLSVRRHDTAVAPASAPHELLRRASPT